MNTLKLKRYQEEAVTELVSKTKTQLDKSGTCKKIVFNAPTGAGKTVMTLEALNRITMDLPNENHQYSKVAYVWIAPNQLYLQSYLATKGKFANSNTLNAVLFNDIDKSFDGHLQQGQILFVNWQSIYREDNIMVRGSEQISSIFDTLRRTAEQERMALVCIIDEEHLFLNDTDDDKRNKSQMALEQIDAKVEIRISATPQTRNPDDIVKISRQDVISEGMIKMSIALNSGIGAAIVNGSVDTMLLQSALDKRIELAKAYNSQGININPLLLIQLPNDSSETMSTEETQIKEYVIAYLNNIGISTDNGRLATWTSKEKVNLDGIERNDSPVDVLLFKQAIAFGWDCPRAAVLLIYRRLNDNTFTIQTIGRIMRMPQQVMYDDPILNFGYVYTNLTADSIRVAKDDMDYALKLRARRRENVTPISLISEKQERSNKENNVLRADFKRFLKEYFIKEWTITDEPELDFEEQRKEGLNNFQAANRKIAKAKINFDVEKIEISIPADLYMQNEEGEKLVDKKAEFARTLSELNVVFIKYLDQRLSGWSKVKSLPVLRTALIEIMEILFGVFETDAIKIILYEPNTPAFNDIIDRALRDYMENVMPKKYKSQASYVRYIWTLPEVRYYNDSTYHENSTVKNHALMPYLEENSASTPEKKFALFLERNSEHIAWWYKNGNNGTEHFAVHYLSNNGSLHFFYVDFIIRLKNGQILLFDTKTAESDPEAVNKHNALLDYMDKERNNGRPYIGGVIIERNGNWLYSPMRIEDTSDINGWTTLSLAELNQGEVVYKPLPTESTMPHNKFISTDMIIIDCKIDSFPVTTFGERTHIEYNPATDKLVVQSDKEYSEEYLKKFLNDSQKINALLSFKSRRTGHFIDGEYGELIIKVGNRTNTITFGTGYLKLPVRTPWQMRDCDIEITRDENGKMVGRQIPWWE